MIKLNCDYRLAKYLGVLVTFAVFTAHASAEEEFSDEYLKHIASRGERNSSESQISRYSKEGMHFEAMAKAREIGLDQLSSATKIAAAKSAWALGLTSDSKKLWDDLLADNQFTGNDRARAMLARAIIELQEENYEKARAFAEKGARELKSSDLRAQFWLVVAEALKGQGALSQAEQYYERATLEGEGSTKNEAYYLLGATQLELGLIDEARYSFAEVTNTSPYAARALEKLVEIDLQQRDYEGVLTWVKEGRESYPEHFQSASLDYALLIALLHLGHVDKAQNELNKFRDSYSDTDPWYQLAQSAVESKLVQRDVPRARLAVPEETKEDTRAVSTGANVTDRR